MPGDIFYSNVDPMLVKELTARANAGFTARSIADINYMFGKISNVEIRAYDGPIPNKEKLVKPDTDQLSEEADPLAILGGGTVRDGSYLPSTEPSGFLIKDGPRQGHRIPPVITLAEINIGDHSMGLLNKATVNITISDPTADFDNFERIWFRPGRHVSVIIQCPETAIITATKKGSNPSITASPETNETTDPSYTGGILSDNAIPSEEKLKQIYGPTKITEIRDSLKKMNYVRFDGLITSFQFTFQVDGTVESTISLTGTSNVYPEVSLLLPKVDKKETTKKGETDVKTDNEEDQTLYTAMVNQINIEKLVYSHHQQTPESVQSIQITPQGLTYPKEYNVAAEETSTRRNDIAIAWGELYPQYEEATEEADEIPGQQNTYTFVTLGYLVEFINDNILGKLENKNDENASVVTNPRVICNDIICKSRRYEYLVSSDPSKILLSVGNKYSTNKYPDQETSVESSFKPTAATGPASWQPKNIVPITTYMGIDNNSAPFQDINNNCSYPSRIFIGVETVLKEILEHVKTVNDLYKSISATISKYTGGAINMSLITHPKDPDKLLYYDSRYLGDITEVNKNSFTIPMFAQTNPNSDVAPEEIKGTIVYDAKISSKLPDSLKNLSYVLNQGSEISESEIAPFVSYMYADKKQKEKIGKNYEETYHKNIKSLNTSKALLTGNPRATANIERLRQALVNYVKYPTPNIADSNKLSAPIYPFDVELTIEGINGFKYGDVVHIPALPTRYQEQTIFSIINVTHAVDSGGHWSTKIRLIMRPKIGT